MFFSLFHEFLKLFIDSSYEDRESFPFKDEIEMRAREFVMSFRGLQTLLCLLSLFIHRVELLQDIVVMATS